MMIRNNVMLAFDGPLPQWLNFLAMAAAILMVAAGTLIWYVAIRKGRKRRKKRKHRRNHHQHHEPRKRNPTLAETGGLPPIREEKEPDVPTQPS